MATISLCMIVKDEELTLERCLQCAKGFADEIVVADTGSMDRTKEIAEKYADVVCDFQWCADFAAARNFSFSKATKDYCMWLDADDVVPESEQKKIVALKEKLEETKADVVMMPYDVAFDAGGKPTFSYFRERIVKNTGRPLWEGRVHEVITPYGNIIHEDIHVEHRKEKAYDTDRNLLIYEKMRAEGCVFSPREQFYYARELYYHGRYGEAIDEFRMFMGREGAWLENKLEACRQMAITVLRWICPGRKHAVIWDGIISTDRHGEKQLSGMKQLCGWKNGKMAADLSEKIVMDTCLASSFVFAMIAWDGGKKPFLITKWRQYSSRRTGL